MVTVGVALPSPYEYEHGWCTLRIPHKKGRRPYVLEPGRYDWWPPAKEVTLCKKQRNLAMEDWSLYALVDASGRRVSLPPHHLRSVELAMRAQLPAPDHALVSNLSIRMHVGPIGWVVGFYRKEMVVTEVIVWADLTGRVW